MAERFRWKNGIPTPKVSADVFGQEFEKIRDSKPNKLALARDVVEAAAAPGSPIHELFKWDNAVAGDLYRRQQARHYMSGLEIVPVKIESNSPVSNRAYHIVDTAEGRGYVARAQIVSNPDYRMQIVRTARRELENFMKKFEHISLMASYIPGLRIILDQMRDDLDGVATQASRRIRPEDREEEPAAADEPSGDGHS
jgi:hypothetical protein